MTASRAARTLPQAIHLGLDTAPRALGHRPEPAPTPGHPDHPAPAPIATYRSHHQRSSIGLSLVDPPEPYARGTTARLATIQFRTGCRTYASRTNHREREREAEPTRRAPSGEERHTPCPLHRRERSKRVRGRVDATLQTRAIVAGQQHCPIQELLDQGEGAYVEYKSTLRRPQIWDA